MYTVEDLSFSYYRPSIAFTGIMFEIRSHLYKANVRNQEPESQVATGILDMPPSVRVFFLFKNKKALLVLLGEFVTEGD
jgi:hypothetical protein